MKYNTLLKWSYVLCIVLISLQVTAQENTSNILATKKTGDGRFNFIKFKANRQGQTPTATSNPEYLKKILGLGTGHLFVPDQLINNNPAFSKDKKGANHVRYRQYFKGLKVEFGDITSHSKNGILDVLTGDYYNVPAGFSTTPLLTEKAALSKAISFIGATKFSWDDKLVSNPVLKSMPKGELVICRNYIAQARAENSVPQMELAYKFAIYATEPLRYDYIYVSARTGNVILVNPIIKHADGTGATRYSGIQRIATTQVAGGNHILKDTTGNYNIATYDLKRGSNYSSASVFSDNDNNWSAAEHNNKNYDNAALDAHWGAMKTLDYWKTVHNRNSFDNKGARINSYVHYGNLYPNAFWDGYSMTYGDGDSISMFPFTSIDICGHEIGHAVCEYTANLIYANESGAINEGFSDIWGACIKRFADPSKNTWLMGDEISATHEPIRSMSNPKSQGHPDTYKGTNWFVGFGDNGGVHYNSGVMNHWFYILTEGKTGTNDKGIAYKVAGIGITKAAQIAYRAENLYLYPNAGYADARIAAIQAAEDLFGAGSNEVVQTTEAWNAVGVADALSRPDNVTAEISGADVVVKWRFNTFQSPGGFKVERAINGTGLFAVIGTVDGGVRSFTDSKFIDNSLNQYRIKSFKDSLHSDYSDVASVAVGNAPFIMTNGTFDKCNTTFFDPGGRVNYSPGYYTTTVRPTITGNKLKISFSEFNIYPYDHLYIYNGASTSAPLLGSFTGSTLPPVLESSAAGGELTFVFNAYYSNSYPGWKAYISCIKSVASPTNLSAKADDLKNVLLSWKDNADDEPGYVLERSINDTTHFMPIADLPYNTIAYKDSAAPDNSRTYYRVRALGESVSSTYSNIAVVTLGSLYIMRNGNVSTCGTTFLSPGELGYFTTTFRPATVGRKLKIAFNRFNTSYGSLYVYNGPSSSSPLLGVYSGSSIPPVLQSTAPGGELTFEFNAYYNDPTLTWTSYISCYKPVVTPTDITAVSNNTRNIQLSWKDNADDETSYVIERSLQDSLHFVSLVTLTANTTGYNDTSVPADSYVFYRLMAYRDTVSSSYSKTASVVNGSVYAMQNGSYSTCNVTFLDPGGTGNYTNGYYTTTIRPASPGNSLKVTFSQFNVSYDNLYVYDGPSSASPLLGSYSSASLPPVLTSTAPGGELTFVFSSYYSNNAPGWAAKISCFKTVLKPSGVKAISESPERIKLSWADNADDETKYLVERSVNALGLYKQITSLPSNTTTYTDSAAPANSLIYYRVRAYRDNLASLYSDTAAISFGNAPYLIKDSTVITCDKVFMDAGGVDVIPFSNYSYNTLSTTLKPSISGNNLKVAFSNFKINGTLRVYNGSSSNSPLLASLTGNYNNTTTLVFNGTGADGSLTFVYQGYSSYADSGWVAQVICYKPVAKPLGIKATKNSDQKVEVTWTDNADDETKYIIERSVNSASLYTTIAQLSPNSTQYIDNSVPANSLISYRVKALRDTLSSFYGDTATIAFGNAPFLMKDSILVTCDKVFMDPGGADVIPSSIYYYDLKTTFKPGIDGYKLKATFDKFHLYNGAFQVYDGPSTSSPLIGSYRSGFNGNPGTLIAKGSSGSLTFYFFGYANLDSGWVAQIECYKPVAKPSKLTAIQNDSEQIRLKWADNADNETRYVVERSVNAKALFAPIVNLPANTTQYVDTTAPANTLFYYRVKAYKDTLESYYSDTASIAFGNVPFLMNDTTLITCNKVFMDPGGADINTRNYNITTTFKPAIPGNNISVAFSQFKIRGGYLSVYNGPNSTSPLIGRYTNSYDEPFPRNFTGTGPDGSLTFVYEGYSYNDSGWIAQVSCYKPVAKPSQLTATTNTTGRIGLAWEDNADDETTYVVERSANSPSLYSKIADLPSNATNYTDSSAPVNNLFFYRVRAFRDSVSSFYSDTASVASGKAPFLMRDSTIITCDQVFMDPGGVSRIPEGRYYYTRTTFKPGIDGGNIRVAFSKFSLTDVLEVYDGSSTGNRLIGRFTGNYSNPLVFDATGSEGSLTFQYQGYHNYDSGWVAQVSCYKPVAKPAGLKVVSQTAQDVKLSWTDRADDETRYVVERAVNGYSLFKPIAQLAANTTEYTDNALPANSFVNYRVKAYRDTLSSLPSDTASIALGNTPFLMSDSTVITCGREFMDPGGADAVPLRYYNTTTTFKPGVSGNKIKVVFSKLSVGYPLYVYDGSSSKSPLIGTYSYYGAMPPTVKATNAEGSLTFVYVNYWSLDSGWVAQVSCYKPVTAPSSLTVDTTNHDTPKLSWTDNANNETGYIVERSTSDSFHYQSIAKVPANTTSYTDAAAPGNSFIYYRVAAYIDTSNSDYSNPVSVVTGVPFVMHNTTITTCNTIFLDPGGLGNYNNGYYTTTVKPATEGNVIKVQFSEFRIDGSLYVYNGPSSSSPLLGSYYGSTLPPVLQSSALGGELTFVFSPYYSNYNPGWIASLSCHKPVLKPSGIKAVGDSSTRVSITWTDNAQDETRYVVERSVNAPSLFIPLAQLSANTSQYNDNAAPANSILYYRVRAYRDIDSSFYSDTAGVAIGKAPLLMKDTTLITCNEIFMDPGGLDIISLNTTYSTRTTFKPGINGNNVRAAFSKINLGGYLYVYNGSSEKSPLIASLNYYSNPSSVFNSTAADGSLTFVYTHSSYNDSGWVAQVSCYKPVAKPSELRAVADSAQKIRLTWKDNADDETTYVVERSVNASSSFNVVAQLPSNKTFYTDSTAPANTLLSYRVRAFRDTLASFYSDTATIALGNAPFLMKDSTLITCDKVFMDPGGADVIPREDGKYYNLVTTFKPGSAELKVMAAFSKFKLNGYLYVYNGSSTNNPPIGYLSSYSNSLSVFNSTAVDGSLTFAYSGTSYGDSGWVAQISCYKPVEPPTEVKAIADSLKQIVVSWTDNADDETRYVLERSDNAPSQFKVVGSLPANSNKYTDSTAPANSLLHYRVRAYRDLLGSYYSNTAIVALGNAPFLMKDSTIITCNKVFMDPGGLDINDVGNYNNIVTTFKPGSSGNKIKVAFSQLRLNGYLYVYDGPSRNSPLIGRYESYSYYSALPVLKSTAVDGSLTFVFSGYSYNDSGWVAQVSCVKEVAKPSGLTALIENDKVVKLSWTDSADDETKYVVERSVDAPSKYAVIAQLSPNINHFTDSTAPANSLLYYRVRAYRDTLPSLYSDTAIAAIGNSPFLMKDSTLITCDKVFMDMGGSDVIPRGIYYNTYTTFKPAINGNNIKVAFKKMLIEGTLSVYDGPTKNSPLLYTFYPNNSDPVVLQSTASDGSLTFVYTGYSYSNQDSGWMAQVSCFKRVASPAALTVTSGNQKNVQLKWTDEANDETGYMVERSFNDSLQFVKLATLPANTTSYTDTSAAENSFIFYRVRANRDSIVSAYSNKVSVLNGTIFTMRSGKLDGCGITFLDPGGAGNYAANSNYTTTFAPSEPAKKVQVTFKTFNTESCCDYLNVYDGPNTSSPLLGTYLGSAIPPVLKSSAANGELTFVFTSDGSTPGTGWSADITCIRNSSDTIDNCPTDSGKVNTIVSNITGTSYQWQKYNGTTFTNIYNDVNYLGTNTITLRYKTNDLNAHESFRCIVNGMSSKEFTVVTATRWTGEKSTDWSNPQNWSCGKVPDANTNVFIEGNKANNPILKTNGECRSIHIFKGAVLTITPGNNLYVRH